MTTMAGKAAVEESLRRLREHGDCRHPDLGCFDFERMCRLLGFGELRSLGSRWESFRPRGTND